MDSQSLTLLVEIIDSGNLSQAARKLKMTRANVSYHLTQLEKAAGVQLVKRTTRRVEPTEIGMRLYEHGRNIHNEMLAAREAITALGQSLQGRVGISVPSGYGQIVMSEWLIEFKRLYPGIVLDPQGPPVPVQLFDSSDLPQHWPRLDAFEGPGYERVTVTVRTGSGDLAAMIYALAPDAVPDHGPPAG